MEPVLSILQGEATVGYQRRSQVKLLISILQMSSTIFKMTTVTSSAFGSKAAKEEMVSLHVLPEDLKIQK